MRKIIFIGLIALLVGCASGPQSTDSDLPEPVELAEARVVAPEYFLDYIVGVQQAARRGMPRELSEREMEDVDRTVDDLREMLDGVQDVQQLSKERKIEVFNATQELWATIHDAQHDRIICEDAVRVGTRIKSTDCRTSRQLDNDRNQYREFIRESLYAPQVPPGGGG